MTKNPFELRLDPTSIPSVDEALRRVDVARDAGWVTPDVNEVVLAEEVKRLRAENEELAASLSIKAMSNDDAQQQLAVYDKIVSGLKTLLEAQAKVDELEAENYGLRSQRDMWQADKQVFDARATKVRMLEAENADQKKRLLFLTTACQGYESAERKLKATLAWFEDRAEFMDSVAEVQPWTKYKAFVEKWELERPKPTGNHS